MLQGRNTHAADVTRLHRLFGCVRLSAVVNVFRPVSLLTLVRTVTRVPTAEQRRLLPAVITPPTTKHKTLKLFIQSWNAVTHPLLLLGGLELLLRLGQLLPESVDVTAQRVDFLLFLRRLRHELAQLLRSVLQQRRADLVDDNRCKNIVSARLSYYV